MPKCEIEVNELVNSKVSRVALVKRGSNRLPFRLLKEDNEMLDFSRMNLSSLFKTEEQNKPAVYAVVVAKSADMEQVKKAVTDAGLSIDKQSEKDGMIVFVQDGVSDKDVSFLKISDEVGFAVTGLAKGFESWEEGKDFMETLSIRGFYPSVRMATEAFADTVHNVMWKAENPAEAANEIGKMTADFSVYLKTLASSLPVHAFKFEKAEDERLSKAAEKKAPAKGEKDEAKDAKPAATKKDEKSDAKEPGEGKDDDKSKDATDDKNGKVEKTEATGDLSAIIAAAMATAMEGLENKLEKSNQGLRDDLQSMNDKVKSLSKQVLKTAEALDGTVINDADEDNPPRKELQKSERSAPPLLDTGFMAHPKAA